VTVSLTSAHMLSMPEDEAFMRTVPYASAVGVLMYLAIAMHPDIAFAVGMLCCFMVCPGPEHWKAVKHLFCYLHSTVDYCLTYTPDSSAPTPFYAYSDADHGRNCNNTRSTSTYVIKIGSGAVSWMLHLQQIVALFTTEAEFIAAASAGQEVVWMRQLLGCCSPIGNVSQSAVYALCGKVGTGSMCHAGSQGGSDLYRTR
jgi:hypothetical protein